jgi:hypothetical protein
MALLYERPMHPYEVVLRDAELPWVRELVGEIEGGTLEGLEQCFPLLRERATADAGGGILGPGKVGA